MKQKLLIFHPALAPYRIDFFNSLCDKYETKIYFQYKSPIEQSFNEELINNEIDFKPNLLKDPLCGKKNFHIEIFNIIKKENPNVIFISDFNLIGIIVILYKWIHLSKFKIITICDDNIEMSCSFSNFRNYIRTLILRNVDAVIFASLYTQKWYESKFSGISRYLYFPIIQSERYFIDGLKLASSTSSSIYKSLKLNSKTILLYVGRLAPVKKIPLLLNMFRDLHTNHPECILLLVGDGELEATLKEESISLGIDKWVIFAGKQEGIQLKAFYNLGDIFIFCSTKDAFGTVINEALISGCYVFCSPTIGAACLIKNKINGELIEMEDPSFIANKIDDYLNSHPSFDKSNKMLCSFDSIFNSLVAEIEKL